MKNYPIGIFDSGIGGLTVLEKIYEIMPNENFIYLADHHNCPYGIKTEDEIRQIVIKNALFLESMNVKCIVVACNTASLFIEDIKKNVKIPVIGVIEHTCKMACDQTQNQKIGVIATNMTIKNAKYQSKIKENNMEAYSIACSEFVDYIENDLNDIELGRKIVKEKLNKLSKTNIDTLIYGCTHFSIIENLIKEELGSLNYVDCGTATAIFLKKFLLENNLISSKSSKEILLYTTGKENDILKHIDLFKIPYKKIIEVKI